MQAVVRPNDILRDLALLHPKQRKAVVKAVLAEMAAREPEALKDCYQYSALLALISGMYKPGDRN